MGIHRQLKKFNKKKSPAQISLNYEKAITYDMYAVYIKHPMSGVQYLFESYHNGKIKAKKWDDDKGKFDIPVEIDPSELNDESFSGTFFYKAHQAEFSSLKDLVFWREWIYKVSAVWENVVHSRTKYRYRMKRQTIKKRMQVLDAVIELYLDKEELTPVPITLIMNKVFSDMWIYHDKTRYMWKELRLSLSAFEASGDVIKQDENNYLPHGKALLTQEKYLDEEKKYSESKRIQVGMLFAAGASFLAALASAYAAFMTLPKP
jgi:hypothetical protein